jgi:fructose-bisphosphate aldolase class II
MNNKKTLKECILEAQEKSIAIGHFNISNSDGFSAVVEAAKELNVPVIIGVSEGERDYIGVNEIVALVKAYREKTNQLVFVNADHTYSLERVKEAVDAGFDSIIFDGTELTDEQNIEITKECIKYAKLKDSNILVEAELGFIGKSSKILEGIPEGAGKMTDINTAKEFVEMTGIDMLAPAVGNIHGMVKTGEPALNIERIREIKESVKIPLVLHGASGNSESDIREAIKAGISIVHINTELRVAYRQGLMKSLSENPDEISPYKYLKGARNAMKNVVLEKLKIFNNIK